MDPFSNWSLSRVVGVVLPLTVVFLSGCIRVKTEPIRVEPIYIEITINHRVQKVLDDIFSDLDQASQTTDYKPVEEEPPSSNN